MTRSSGRKIPFSQRGIDITQPPLALGAGDAIYVRAVLRLGGFTYRTRIGGRIVEVRP